MVPTMFSLAIRPVMDEWSHVVTIAAVATTTCARCASIGNRDEGGCVVDICHVADFNVSIGIAVTCSPEGESKFGEVVGECGECKHVDVAFHLGGVGARVSGLTITTIDKRSSTVVHYFGDRSIPAYKLLYTATLVIFEVFCPLIVNRDGDGVTGRSESGSR